MALRDWAQRTLERRTSPAAEGDAEGVVDPQAIVSISLTAEGTVWESWQAPFADWTTFVNEAEAVIASYAEECPKRRVPLLFTAQTASGEIKTQCPSSVMGKNQQADALVGSGNNSVKAFSDGMHGLAGVLTALTKSQKEQVESLMKTIAQLQTIIEQKDEQIHAFAEYFRVKQEVEATEAKNSADASTYILDQVKALLPLGVSAAEVFIDERKKSLASSVVKAVAQAAAVTPTTPSNGAITS